MKKNYFLLLFALTAFAGKGLAQTTQPCATDEVYREYKQRFPQIAVYEKMQEENIKAYTSAHPARHIGAKTTAAHDDTGWYDIPVVVHIMHNAGAELVSDDNVYKLISEMNNFYNSKNDTSNIIKPFKKWVGTAKIRFHLATIDPSGKPTKGITHHRSYLTYGGDDQVKMDQWSPINYYNIWFENVIGRGVAGGIVLAYACFPAQAAGYPPIDGVISRYNSMNDGNNFNSSTLDHETGHYFNLLHTWNSSGKDCGVACGDDEVDDTPPTKGHYSTCDKNDTACAVNYFKIYPNMHGLDSLVNYPDTANTQNTMDYSSCTNMFTKGQVTRMRAALNSNVGGRNNLWDSVNLVITGATAPYPDLKPIPEFSATIPGGIITRSTYFDKIQYFTFPSPTASIGFTNNTWNDTLTAMKWEFSNGASTPTSTSMSSVNNSFSVPGWVDLKMTATGNHSGDTTVDFPRAVFVANTDATPGIGYYQEFNGADTAQWPMFNYYNNEFKWQHANVGYADNNSVMYTGYDARYIPGGYYPATGSPRGDFDDLFTVPMDLTGFAGGPCSLNFRHAGASRTSNSNNINDTLYIDYAVGKSYSWAPLTILAKNELCNRGAYPSSYVPYNSNEWDQFSFDLPAAARQAYVTFRFRYKPGAQLEYDGTTYVPGTLSSGNNFYMDRLTFSPWAAGIGDVKMGAVDVVVAPNPTSGDAYVAIKDANNATANVIVTDVTGKVVFTTSKAIVDNRAEVTIPHTAISVPGLYLVQTVTGNQATTKKLVVQ